MKKKIPKLRRIKILKRKILTSWSIAVRNRYDNKCAVCGCTENLNAHHIVPKEQKDNALKYDIKNGISLCAKHHKYGYDISPHKNPIKFFEWLITNDLEQYEYCLKNADKKIIYTEDDLIAILASLKKLNN